MASSLIFNVVWLVVVCRCLRDCNSIVGVGEDRDGARENMLFVLYYTRRFNMQSPISTLMCSGLQWYNPWLRRNFVTAERMIMRHLSRSSSLCTFIMRIIAIGLLTL